VLSEISAEWYRAIRLWRTLNAARKMHLAGAEVPCPREEYLFYQTLVGLWPMNTPGPEEHEELVTRVDRYFQKAIREAKVHTSWINPNAAYEEAVTQFVRSALERSPDNKFLSEFTAFSSTIARAGMWNSLSQTLVKICSPGVPDFYQGSELWDFSLVDPDNRRPVDYRLRRCLLNKLQLMEVQGAVPLLEQLLQNPADGAVKLFVTSRALRFRRANHEVFAKGSYIPLKGAGDLQNHLIAFARASHRTIIAVAARFFMALGAAKRLPLGEEAWGDSELVLRKDLPGGAFRDVFTQRTLEVQGRNGRRMIRLANVFAHLPVALLEGV